MLKEIPLRLFVGLAGLVAIAGWCWITQYVPDKWEVLMIIVFAAPTIIPDRYLWCGLTVSGVITTLLAIYSLLTVEKIFPAGFFLAAFALDAAAILSYRKRGINRVPKASS